MGQSTPYQCVFLNKDGSSMGTIDLAAETDSDAIILGNTIEHEHSDCARFEIREGERLVYRLEGGPFFKRG